MATQFIETGLFLTTETGDITETVQRLYDFDEEVYLFRDKEGEHIAVGNRTFPIVRYTEPVEEVIFSKYCNVSERTVIVRITMKMSSESQQQRKVCSEGVYILARYDVFKVEFFGSTYKAESTTISGDVLLEVQKRIATLKAQWLLVEHD